uniref:Integrase, catalytic region, zinc finger, CCHC-type, peptidase aspartic, catalytic n=1 Tax=Tanacetum cinerariifolium TaxID=118510 RepID=A0A699H361_TANCI|nr:hypothetical protein [Tanacetum cinerariifolium]
MLTKAAVAESEDSGTPTESQPTPSPTQPTARDQPPLTESSLEHDSYQDPKVNLEGISGSGKDQVNLPHDCPLSGGRTSDRAEGSLNLEALSALCTNLSNRKAVNKGRQNTVDAARPDVSTARPYDDTASPDVSTARQELSTAGLTTNLTTITIFDDEEITLIDTLIKLKDDKAKGVAFKDSDNTDRPTRSILTLKPLLKIDPKDKGKGVLKEPESTKKMTKSCCPDDIQCAGYDTRPPMLDRTDFASWQQRTEREPHLGPEQPRVYSDLSPEEKDQYNADIRATNILLQGLPKEIYTLINHYTDAKDIWDNVKMLLEDSKLIKEDQES